MGLNLFQNILGEINPWTEDAGYTGDGKVGIYINRNGFLDTMILIRILYLCSRDH